MIRRFFAGCLAAGWLLLALNAAAAQEDVFIPVDAGVVTFYVGWTTAENDATDKNADGASFQFTGDWVTFRPRISIGVSVASMNQHQEFDGVRNNLNTVPVYLSAKYWFGKESGRVYGYTGVCLGGYNSTFETTDSITDDYKRDQTSGFAFAVPAGVAVFIGKRVLLTASYQFNWMNQSYYKDDIAHLFLIGAGLTFGIGE